MEKINSIMTRLYVRIREQRGQAMPEYAVIAAAIIVAAYGVFQVVGVDVHNTMQTVVTALTPAS